MRIAYVARRRITLGGGRYIAPGESIPQGWPEAVIRRHLRVESIERVLVFTEDEFAALEERSKQAQADRAETDDSAAARPETEEVPGGDADSSPVDGGTASGRRRRRAVNPLTDDPQEILAEAKGEE
jgi:hypothetical protein